MLSDFEMIQHRFPKNEDLTIVPISDVHLGAAEHMAKEWRDFCAMVEKTPNVYITLGGGLINNSVKTSVGNVFDETMRPREQKRVMAKMLKPISDRILCAVSGNHERRSGKDIDNDPMYDIMCKLDLEHLYRENMAFVKIQMGKVNGDGKKNPTYCICVTHGAGGGILSGGTINRNERFGYVLDGVDALIVGHTHKPMISQPAKIVVDKFNNKISFKPFKVISSTAWLDFGGYTAQKMLIPSSYALQTMTLFGKRKDIVITM